jgi:hypothetical protein
MAANETVMALFRDVEKKLGFRFACDLHHALVSGYADEARALLRRALARTHRTVRHPRLRRA